MVEIAKQELDKRIEEEEQHNKEIIKGYHSISDKYEKIKNKGLAKWCETLEREGTKVIISEF